MKKDTEMLKKLEDRYKRGEIPADLYEELKKQFSGECGSECSEIEKAGADVKHRVEKISISGAGKLSGPLYCETMAVSGAGHIDGDVDTIEFRASGSAKIEGDLRAKEIKISGASSVEGDVNAETVESSGAFKVEGDLTAHTIEASGALKVEGAVKADRVKCAGGFSAESVDAGEVELRGEFRVDDHIKADKVFLTVGDDSSVESIEGDEIEIRKGIGFLLMRSLSFFKAVDKLKVETIKGRVVRIESVTAETVTGEDVEIGPGCRIGTLKAKTARVHEDAKVGKRVAVKSE